MRKNKKICLQFSLLFAALFILNYSLADKKETKKSGKSTSPVTNCGDSVIVNKLIGKWLNDDSDTHRNYSGGGHHQFTKPTKRGSKGFIFMDDCTYQDIFNDVVGEPAGFTVIYDSIYYKAYVLCTNTPNCYAYVITTLNAETLLLTHGRKGNTDYSVQRYIKVKKN